MGAGPTGLMLGVQLARRGVRVMVIDKNAGPSVRTKALGVQARTLEIYSKLGIAEQALELGTRAVGATMWVRGRRAARVPLGNAGTGLSPFPFLLILVQDDNERLLGGKLRELGGVVRWSTELVGIDQHADGVTATLRHPDGATARVEADRLAGCDGSRSAVRQLCGIDFPGAPYEHVFFVADARAIGPMVPGELNVYLWRGGFHLFFPMRGAGHWRAVGILPVPLRGRDGVGFDDVTPHIRGQVGPALRFTGCDWFSTYRIHHRRAARFRDRRCFLLGDAAHVHSPVGAQGMNTGLQDAYNLAWKLALVSSGRAAESLLDTYEAERIPVAERLLGTTDRAFSVLVSDGWLAGQLRTRVMPRVWRGRCPSSAGVASRSASSRRRVSATRAACCRRMPRALPMGRRDPGTGSRGCRGVRPRTDQSRTCSPGSTTLGSRSCCSGRMRRPMRAGRTPT
ncbi:MAG: FAD-dependent monooxygenase [Phycisphaerales bacterium]